MRHGGLSSKRKSTSDVGQLVDGSVKSGRHDGRQNGCGRGQDILFGDDQGSFFGGDVWSFTGKVNGTFKDGLQNMEQFRNGNMIDLVGQKTLNGRMVADRRMRFGQDSDGLDTLFGGTGADTFVFESASAYNNIDVIKDFSVSDGDKLNLANLLTSYNPLTHAIEDFVRITESGGHSLLAVDRDGTGSTYGFQQIATIENVTGLTDEAALKTAGTLITA